MLSVLYMVLINDQLYNLISFFTYHSHHGNLNSLAGKDEFYLGFHKFSQQWLAILTFLPLLSLLFIKNLTFLIRLTAIGVFSVGIFFVYIAYIFFDNIHNIDMSQIKLFSWNLGDLAGTCALAFTIHTVVAPIIKRNQNQSKNERDLVISYGSGERALILSKIMQEGKQTQINIKINYDQICNTLTLLKILLTFQDNGMVYGVL